MVLIDTSAWIEFFRSGNPAIVQRMDRCLEREIVAIGDLIYCEIMQGIYDASDRKQVSKLLLSLPQFELCGFAIAEKASQNYRVLRSKGITVRKTIDVIIGTFCVENDLTLLHNDIDFSRMSFVLGLKVYA